MLRTTATSVASVLIAIAGMAGSAGTEPDQSQRLRGLRGRVFLVRVQDLLAPPGSPGEFFDNCYTFYPGGTWDHRWVPLTFCWSRSVM